MDKSKFSICTFSRFKSPGPISTMASGWPVWGTIWWWGQAVVSRVLHIPLSSFPSALHITNQKDTLRVTAWLLNTFISLSPLTIRLFDDGSLKWVITLSFWVLNAFPQERKLQLNSAEKRTRVVRELLKSERKYVQMLEIVRDVYVRPLRAALSSNRAILSAANIQIMFSDILQILCLNR